MPVPDLRMRPGDTSRQRGVKQEVKPKESRNHPGEPGKGKNGRVNASEPSWRLRDLGSPETMVNQDGDARVKATGRFVPCRKAEAPACTLLGHHDPGV